MIKWWIKKEIEKIGQRVIQRQADNIRKEMDMMKAFAIRLQYESEKDRINMWGAIERLKKQVKHLECLSLPEIK